MSLSERYFKHLRTRSILGYAYRHFYLYPRLNRFLSGKVIDIGCGLGQFLSYRKNTIGIDVNPLCIDHCREQKLTVKLIYSPPWNFNAAEFDGALLDNVLEHILDPEKTLREIHRILKDKGVLIVGVPGQKGFLHDPDHKVFYDAESLGNLIQRYDFRPIKYFYTPFKSNFLNESIKQYCLFGVFEKS
jgi:SAM-dependent methyltransferase